MEAFGVTECSKVDMVIKDPDLGDHSFENYLDIDKKCNDSKNKF